MAVYQLKVVDKAGTVIATLANVRLNNMSWVLSAQGSFSFTMYAKDPNAVHCKAPENEIQVWRDAAMIWWGAIVKSRGDEKTVTFECATLDWYFTRRIVGAPIVNRLLNPSFENANGNDNWTFSYTPWANPMVNPAHMYGTVADAGFPEAIHGARTMRMTTVHTGVDWQEVMYMGSLFKNKQTTTKLRPSGIERIKEVAAGIDSDFTIQVVGHTDNQRANPNSFTAARAATVKEILQAELPSVTITSSGAGASQPWATNTTAQGRTANNRVVVHYRRNPALAASKHQQYLGQAFLFTNPVASKRKVVVTFTAWCWISSYTGASHANRGLFIEAQDMTRPHQIPYLAASGYGYAAFNAAVNVSEETPKNKWLRLECQMEIPPDGIEYSILARCIPPSGVAFFDEVKVTMDEALSFVGVDEALIVQGLVQHAQDVAFGKSDLAIATSCPLTGVIKTRDYLFIDRQQISEALAEFPTLSDGVEWDIITTATTRTLTTYYPRKGADTGVNFTVGPVGTGNVAAFSVDVDGEQTSTRIVVQADGEGSDREEGWASDSTLMGGKVMEKVYNATPGSAISSLPAQAARGLARYRRPVTIPNVTLLPNQTTSILAAVKIGDRMAVVANLGWLNLNAQYRAVSITLDPNADQLTYELSPEG